MANRKDKYRFDRRTKEEFARDIAKGHEIETDLLERWLDHLEEKHGERPTVEFTGCGEGGEYLESHEVNDDADYYVDGYGLVEVKFAKPMLERDFHLKVHQVESYIRQESYVLMVLGVETDQAKFALITPETLKDIQVSCKIVRWDGFGGKRAFRVPVRKFVWREL